MLRRFFLTSTAGGAVASTVVNYFGAVAVTIRRLPLYVSLWTGFGERRLYGYIPLALWAGVVGGATTALVFTILRRRPTNRWLQDAIQMLANFLAAMAIGHLCGPAMLGAQNCLLEDALASAHMFFVGCRVIRQRRLRWSMSPASHFNLQVKRSLLP